MFLRRKDAAERLGIEPGTLDDWIAREGWEWEPRGADGYDKYDRRKRLVSLAWVEELARIHGRELRLTLAERVERIERVLVQLMEDVADIKNGAPARVSATPRHASMVERPPTPQIASRPSQRVGARQTIPLQPPGVPPDHVVFAAYLRQHGIPESTGKKATQGGRPRIRPVYSDEPLKWGRTYTRHLLDGEGMRQFHLAFPGRVTLPCALCGYGMAVDEDGDSEDRAHSEAGAEWSPWSPSPSRSGS